MPNPNVMTKIKATGLNLISSDVLDQEYREYSSDQFASLNRLAA